MDTAGNTIVVVFGLNLVFHNRAFATISVPTIVLSRWSLSVRTLSTYDLFYLQVPYHDERVDDTTTCLRLRQIHDTRNIGSCVRALPLRFSMPSLHLRYIFRGRIHESRSYCTVFHYVGIYERPRHQRHMLLPLFSMSRRKELKRRSQYEKHMKQPTA